jgi:hypothetical protein
MVPSVAFDFVMDFPEPSIPPAIHLPYRIALPITAGCDLSKFAIGPARP